MRGRIHLLLYFILICSISTAHGKGLHSALTVDAPAQNEAIVTTRSDSVRQSRIEAASAFSLGRMLERKGSLEEALGQYQIARKADPSYFPTHIREASVLYQLKRPEEALSLLEGLRKSGVDLPQVHALLAFGYLESNETSLAEESLQKALTQVYRFEEKQDAGYYLQMAALLEHVLEALKPLSTKEKISKVEPLYERAAKIDPRNPVIWIKLGDLALEEPDYTKAKKAFETAYYLTPDFPKLREKLAAVLLTLKESAKAVEIFEELVRLEPHRTKLYALLGELYYNEKNLAKAEDYYLLALQLDLPAKPQSYLRVAYIQLERDKPEQAQKWLLEGQKQFPQVPHISLLLALTYRKLKKFDEALAAFAQAEKNGVGLEEFNNSNFYFEYGVTFERKEDIAQAIKFMQKAIEIDAKNHKALNYLGYIWAERGERLEEAEKLVNQALKLNTDNPAYLDSLGWIYYQQGRYQKAKPLLEKAFKQMPTDSVVCEHMGDVYQKLGNPLKALEFWGKALLEAEKPDLLRKKMAQAQAKIPSPLINAIRCQPSYSAIVPLEQKVSDTEK